MKLRHALLSLLFVIIYTASAYGEDMNALIKARSQNPDIKRTIMGILVYLDDMQVRNRPGTRSSFFDSSDTGDGCDGKVEFNLPHIQKALFLPAMPPIKVRNVEGEWESTVHFMPKKFGSNGKSLIAIPDSNLFVPAFVSYPLFLFRENTSPAERRITNMLKLCWNIDKKYKRGDAYNFWLPMKDHPDFSGPCNIPLEKAITPLAKAYINPKLKFIFGKLAKGMNVPPPDWVITCLDKTQNQTGAAALFNIPNDSDDTATAVAIQKIKNSLLYAYKDDAFFNDAANFAVDTKAMGVTLSFRDTGRNPKKEDGRDAWKGANTGAFMTWLLDENQPTFSQTDKGVIPLEKNNVDAVVNSNVLLALGLLNMKDAPGCAEACAVVSKAIFQRTWPGSGLYYPQFMIFPYTASRAYRDGGIEALKPAMKWLMKDVIHHQNSYAAKYPKKTGAFPGGEDLTDFVSTALGVITLLNIGIENAREENMEAQYKAAMDAGINYLLNTRKKHRIKNDETFRNEYGNKGLYGIKWDSGLFFSASFWDLAHWRSEPFCNAMALEAFSKYIMAYEYGGAGMTEGRKIHINKYTTDMDEGMDNFNLEVR